MESFRVKLVVDGRMIADRIEGGIEGRIGDRLDGGLPWRGYLVLPRELLPEVARAGLLRVDVEDSTSYPILADPAHAGATPVVVVAFRSEGPSPLGCCSGGRSRPGPRMTSLARAPEAAIREGPMAAADYRVEEWPIAGRRRVVHIWPDGPGPGRPRSAVFIGGVGWVDVRPEDEGPPVSATGNTLLRASVMA